MDKLKKTAAAVTRKILDSLGRMKLITVYGVVVGLTLLIWAVSLLMSNRFSRHALQSEYEEYTEALFEQTADGIERGISDLVQLSYTVMYSPNFSRFLSAESFSERNSSLEQVDFEFNRLKTIQTDIKGVRLYDASGVMLASSGLKGAAEFETSNSIRFFGPAVSNTGERWFGIRFPVYSVNNSKIEGLLGYCTLQIYLSFLMKRLPENFSSGNEWSVLLNAEGDTLLETGTRPSAIDEWDEFIKAVNAKEEDQQFLRRRLSRSDWQVIFWNPDYSMARNINFLQRINLITYIFTGLLILLLLLGIYASILRPMSQQIRFMNYYAVNRKSRMEVRSHNEMGMLAENLNAMLDDIDHLNEKNLEASQRVLEAEYQKKQSELLAYRNQINPHFLYNTFECIRGMALYYDVPDIAAISEALARFFTYTVRGKGYASIREVRTHVEDYASIIGYRFMDKYRVSCEVDEEARDCIFPKMILQPLVENAIFHGLEPADRDGLVTVRIETVQREEASPDGQKKMLRIEVADNGIGMDEEELENMRLRLAEYDRTNLMPVEKHGIGMVNIYRRLRLFYGQDMTFTVKSKPDEGTVITILVPAETDLSGEEYVPGFFD